MHFLLGFGASFTIVTVLVVAPVDNRMFPISLIVEIRNQTFPQLEIPDFYKLL
jgi:predicted nuclease of restriction endonuclease-like (RecB) superfamily